MRSPWLRWMLVVVTLFSAGANAHPFADRDAARARPCAALHHQRADHHPSHTVVGHGDCRCGCVGCPLGFVPVAEASRPRPLAHEIDLAPARSAVPASHSLSPELGPPRPGCLA